MIGGARLHLAFGGVFLGIATLLCFKTAIDGYPLWVICTSNTTLILVLLFFLAAYRRIRHKAQLAAFELQYGRPPTGIDMTDIIRELRKDPPCRNVAPPPKHNPNPSRPYRGPSSTP